MKTKPVYFYGGVYAITLLIGCRHITEQDAQWVSTQPTTMQEVKDYMGDPDATKYATGRAMLIYADNGHHTLGLMAIPIVNLVVWPAALIELLIHHENRVIYVEYDTRTGKILGVSTMNKEWDDN